MLIGIHGIPLSYTKKSISTLGHSLRSADDVQHIVQEEIIEPIWNLQVLIKRKTLKQNIQWNAIVCTVHAGKS